MRMHSERQFASLLIMRQQIRAAKSRAHITPQISPTSNNLPAPAPQAAGSLIKRLCAVLSAAAAFVV